jgi:hypothetical protein
MKYLKSIFFALLFTLTSSSLFAQEITSFPGTWGIEFYQDKKKLTWKEVNAIMTESQVAQANWQKSKKNAVGGLIFGVANFGSAIWLLSNLDENKPLTGPVIAVAGTGLVGSIFFKAAMKNKKLAILEYNDALGRKMSFRLVPTSNENGLGLALRF